MNVWKNMSGQDIPLLNVYNVAVITYYHLNRAFKQACLTCIILSLLQAQIVYSRQNGEIIGRKGAGQ